MSDPGDREYYLNRERHALSMAAMATQPGHRELHEELAKLLAQRAGGGVSEPPVASSS